ncbi:MAG: fatty acid desaturase, partial [Planctomycetes bacterium]|nr:fatty acid desaturase [Planctomycetota bacterium]
MDRRAYLQIRTRLKFSKSFRSSAVILACDIALIALVIGLLQADEVVSYCIAQILIAITAFHGFSLLHEAGHGNCSHHRAVNTITGHLGSILCGLPYFPWKQIHHEHHVWVGNINKDPTLAAVRNPEQRSKLAIGVLNSAWKSWVPILGLLQQFVFWAHPFRILFQDKPNRRK